MKHQELMNQAYARWNTEGSKNWSQQEFWNQLSYVEKVAVFTGNLNYQVENGGFWQWIANGYSECYLSLISICVKTINTKTSKKVADLVSEAIDRHDYDNYDCDYCQYGCECEIANYDDLDDKFYEVNEQFLKDVQEWLDKQENENV